ncbi:MAG: hypothetical protein DI534_04975 [Leifsonia xyli]|nr:MAG: hypothetical protein DI534_04975 [Leifsonia xyli]
MPRETQAQRIARMEEENARLREELDAARVALEERVTADAAPPPASPAPAPRGRARGRAVASVVLIVIAAILAPVALVANTTQKLLTDTDFFVQTLEPIVDDGAVQQLIIDRTTQAIRQQAGLDQLVADLFAGLDQLDLPPRAITALQLLQGPATDGVGALVERVVTRVVTSDAFSDVIAQSLRITHEQLIAALGGNGEVLQISGTGEVGIALDPILDRVRTALGEAGIPLGSLIPTTDAVIVIAKSAQLAQLVWLYQLAIAVGPWLQWVVVALFLGAVLVARRWATAILGVGIALAIAAGVLGAGIAAGRVFTLGATAGTVPTDAINAIYDSLVASIVNSVAAAVVVGLCVALVAYLSGPYRSSRALRGFADAGAESLREAGERYGVTTARFGELVHRARLGIRVAVGLVAAAIILFVRPLTPAIVIWTLVLALLVVLVARILERPVAAPEPVEAQPVG